MNEGPGVCAAASWRAHRPVIRPTPPFPYNRRQQRHRHAQTGGRGTGPLRTQDWPSLGERRVHKADPDSASVVRRAACNPQSGNPAIASPLPPSPTAARASQQSPATGARGPTPLTGGKDVSSLPAFSSWCQKAQPS